MVKVPDVTGKTYEEAQKELNKYDLGIHKSTAPSDTVAKGKIISQDPADGKKVKKHTTVNVVISSGEEAKMTTIPSVVGLAEADAEKALQAKNLVVKKGDPVYSDDVEQGEVVSVSPSEGAEVKEGTTVTLVISRQKFLNLPESPSRMLKQPFHRQVCPEMQLKITVIL